MSMTRLPERKLFNALDTNSLDITSGVVTIQGLPSFNVADVEQCFRVCKTACVAQVTTVVPTVPTTPCECPWNWSITIRRKPCLDTGETDQLVTNGRMYDYQDNSGATPTVNEIITSIIAQIDADPNSNVTAAGIGGVGTYTSFTLTEKNCGDTFYNRTCGFEAFVTSGTVTYTGGSNVAHVDPIVPAWRAGKAFAILPGSAFTEPDLARCGDYCIYHFRVNPSTQVKDPHLSNAMVDRFTEFEIWVDSTQANYATDWATDMEAAFDCF